MRGSAGKTKVGLLLMVLALVVVVLGLTWVVIRYQEGNSSATAVSESSAPLASVTATPTASQPSRGYRTTLTDVSGEDVVGELSKKSSAPDDKQFLISVKLPALSGDGRYGAWLVQSEGTEKRFLGELILSGQDFTLEYSLEEVAEQFDKIIVVSGPNPDQATDNVVATGVIGSQLLL